VAEVMIDIETLSTRRDAAVIAIGMAAFTIDEGVIDTAGYSIDLKHVYGHISTSTFRWWMDQSEDAKKQSFSGRCTPYDAAVGLLSFLAKHDPETIWANSPTFDLVILQSWWDNMPATPAYPSVQHMTLPFLYKKERDCRTMFALASELGIEVPMWHGTAHNPVDDACNQARAVIAIRKELRRRSGWA
jgi:hypothetical protein